EACRSRLVPAEEPRAAEQPLAVRSVAARGRRQVYPPDIAVVGGDDAHAAGLPLYIADLGPYLARLGVAAGRDPVGDEGTARAIGRARRGQQDVPPARLDGEPGDPLGPFDVRGLERVALALRRLACPGAVTLRPLAADVLEQLQLLLLQEAALPRRGLRIRRR